MILKRKHWKEQSMKEQKKMKNSKIRILLITTTYRLMQWQNFVIICALNVNNHILEEEKIVLIKINKNNNLILSQKNQCVVSARDWVQARESKIVQNMEQILQILSVSFAVTLHSGFVGEIHIFVKNAIKDKMQEIMFQDQKEVNCLNALVQINVNLE